MHVYPQTLVPSQQGDASEGGTGISILFEINSVLLKWVSQWSPLNCTFTSQSSHGGHELDSSGMALSWWTCFGTAPGTGWLVLVATATSLQLVWSKAHAEWKWHGVDVRSLAPIVSLYISIPLVLHILAIIDMDRDAASPISVPWLFFPPLGHASQAVFDMYVRLQEIRFTLIRLSICLQWFLYVNTLLNRDWWVRSGSMKPRALVQLQSYEVCEGQRVNFFLSPLVVWYLITSHDSPLPLACTHIITKHCSFVLPLETDTVEACSLTILLTLWGKDRKKHWN